MTEYAINQAQLDLILSALLVCTCGICFCLGWLANESGAK